MDYMRVLMRCMLVSAMRVPPVFLAGVHVLGAALGDGYAVEAQGLSGKLMGGKSENLDVRHPF